MKKLIFLYFVDFYLCLFQPTGLIAFLDSEENIPEHALEQELLNHRDNLKMAQIHAGKSKKNPNWIAVERQLKNVEKRVEHYTNLALQHWGARVGISLERKEKLKERPIVLRRRRERIKAEANWLLFYWKFNQDHAIPNLIWNHKVRNCESEKIHREWRLKCRVETKRDRATLLVMFERCARCNKFC